MATPRRKRRRWPYWLALGGAALGTTLVLGRSHGSQPEIDQSLVVKVRRGDLAIDVIETGKVQPREKVEIKSKVAGQVDKVFVVEGERVKKGQLLLRIDPTDFRRDVARAQADVARAEADIAQADNALDFARLTLERKQRGLQARGTAQIDVDAADNEVKVRTVARRQAEVALAGARVALGAAQDRLRYTEIAAPIDGTVIQRGIEPGEVVTPGVQATFEGKPLLTVADLSTLKVRTELNQIDVARVAVGAEVSLTLDALPGREFHAVVTKVAPAAETPKGKDVEVFPVEATLSGAVADIRPGMTADVRVHVASRAGVLALPIEAVVKDKGGSFVSRVHSAPGQHATVERVAVEVGARNEREVEITRGVAAGESILVKPGSSADNEVKM